MPAQSTHAIRPLVSGQNTSADDAAIEAWVMFCEKIQDVIPPQAYSTWFDPIKPVGFEDHTLSVRVPSRFYYNWIEGHYSAHIERALQEVLGEGSRLIYTLPPKEDLDLPVTTEPFTATEYDQFQGFHDNTPVSTGEDGLNDRYIFDNYIEGPQNSFARAAALAVAQSPGKTPYNPLLLYGGVGLGKTHLLQAIGNEANRISPEKQVLYISTERFTKDFVEAISKHRADEFNARYRKVDILLVDDIQFLAGRERTLMEFFHTFNDLHQSGKQIVVSSDKPPRDLVGLDERLISRLGWGLSCDIGPPDYDTRTAIIQRQVSDDGIALDSQVCDFIAKNFTNNVRELQGAIVRLLAYASINGSDITVDVARTALRDLFDNRTISISIDLIQRVVADRFNLAPDILMAKTRSQPIARPRMIAMALSTKLTGLSLKQVGIHFGKRDHTTVLHARKMVEKWSSEDHDFAKTLEELIKRIELEAI